MSGLPALSIELSAVSAGDHRVRGPRPADAIDAPVTSPVHELQDQLQRLNADSDGSTVHQPAKAPGWVRLSLPLGVSVILWTVILWATGALRLVGKAD